METTHEATDETDGDGRIRRALAGDPEAWGAVLAEHTDQRAPTMPDSYDMPSLPEKK